MLRCGEDNQHVHGDYTEETSPSLNVNDTDEDESKEFIVHEPLSENLSMDVSESDATLSTKLYRRTIHQTYRLMLLRN